MDTYQSSRTVAQGLPNGLKPIEEYFPLLEIILRDLLKKLHWENNYETHFPVLLSEGRYGLIQAYQRYDSSRNIKFETFAQRRIRGAMIDHMRFIFPLSRQGRNLQKRMEDSTHALEQKLQRSPSDLELSEEMGIRLRKLRQFQQRINYEQ